MSFTSNFARAVVPVALVATVTAPAPAATSSELKAVESSLAATQSMTANFLQTDGKGRQMAGTLQLKRPDKIRFAYVGGVNMLLVANGKTLNFVDYDVGQKSSWPISKSPLAVLLSPQPDLGRIARIMPSESPNVSSACATVNRSNGFSMGTPLPSSSSAASPRVASTTEATRSSQSFMMWS